MLGEHRENSGNDYKKQNMYTNDMLLMVIWVVKFLRVGYKIGSLTPSKVLPLFYITEHKAVACLVLPR